MFDGSFKQKRQINLGGSSVRKQQSTVLQEAQADRQKREHERLRAKSATKIQAFWRGRRGARFFFERLFVKVDDALDSTSGELSNADLMLVARILNVAGKAAGLSRVFRFAQMLLSADASVLLCWRPLLDASHKEWTLLLTQFATVTVWTSLLRLDEKYDDIFCNFMSELVLRDEGDLAVRDFRLSLLQRLISQNFYSKIRSFLLERNAESLQHTNFRDKLVDCLLNFTLKPFEHRQSAMLAVQSFSTQLLSIPLLFYRIGLHGIQKLSKHFPFEAIIVGLSENASLWLDEIGSDDTLAFLSNLLGFGNARILTLPSKLTSPFLLATCEILTRLPDAQTVDEEAISEDSDDEDADLTVVVHKTQQIDPRIMRWIETLFSPSILEILFGNFSANALKLMLKIFQKFEHSHEPILNYILFVHPSMMMTSYSVFLTSELGRSMDNVPAVFSEGGKFGDDWTLLLLIVTALGRWLITCGNEEFLSGSMLDIPALISFTHKLKALCFHMYLNPPAEHSVATTALPGTTLDFFRLRKTCTSLLKQIHARDSSYSFCPENFWPVSYNYNLQAILQSYLKVTLESNQKLGFEFEILENIPFVISFDERVLLFHEFMVVDDDHNSHFIRPQGILIRRSHVFEDGFERLNPLGTRLRKPVHIVFVSDLGYEEVGIDGGGLFKEFLTELLKEAFDADRGLFCETSDHQLYPNPTSYGRSEEILEHYRFLGRIIGKAVHEGILLEASFAKFFLTKWLGRPSYLEDLPTLDPELYKNLMFLKTYAGDVQDLALNFTMVSSEFGENKVLELIPGGKDVSVTNQNRMRYIYLVANYKLNTQISRQSNAFIEGMSDVVYPKLLKMFSRKELQLLVSGVDSKIDLKDLRANTVYSGPYDDGHPCIEMFWKILESFSEEEKKRFLRFTTSCSRPPLLGFKQLEPKFGIRHPGQDIERLPSASTCFNLFKLPPYPSEQLMRDKILYSINSGAGFEMS